MGASTRHTDPRHAEGMLAHDAHTTCDHAFTLLRAHAAHTGQGTSALPWALAAGQVTGATPASVLLGG